MVPVICAPLQNQAIEVAYQYYPHLRGWGPFLETPDNFAGPKTILASIYSPIAIQSLLILKGTF